MAAGERWRDVVGWEGFYTVSDRGRIRTVERKYIRKGDGAHMTIPARLRKATVPLPRLNYPCVSLQVRGRKLVLRPVHVLVAAAFIGPRPAGLETRHIDGVKTNNLLTNLRYGTVSENQRDRVLHGTSNRGERCGSAKLTEADVHEIRRLRAQTDMTHKQIATQFGVARESVRDIENGKRWAWLK